MNKICGIYIIKNIINGKGYIGKSVNIHRRWQRHISLLEKNRHTNKHFQQSWLINKKDNFEFIILEECLRDLLNEQERLWIALLKTNDNKYGYNMTAGGDGGPTIISSEGRIRISEALKGRIPWNKGLKNPFSEEITQQISLSNTGKKRTEEQKNNISNSLKGKKKSDEAKKNMSIAKKGKPRPSPSQETIEKIRNSNLGQKRSEETKQRIRIAQIGRITSPETLIKMSESMKGKNTYQRSDATKTKFSDIMVQRWQDPEYREKQLENKRKLNGIQLTNLLEDIKENKLLQKDIAIKYGIVPSTVTRYKQQLEKSTKK